MKTMEYMAEVLPDGHLSLSEEIVKELNLSCGSKVKIILVSQEENRSKNLLALAGFLDDLSKDEIRQLEQIIKNRPRFSREINV